MSIRTSIQRMRADIRSAYRSQDTEAVFDRFFTKPLGYLWTRLFMRLGWTPNMVTLLSMGVGFAGGALLYPRFFTANLLGVLLVIWARILDSADGQLARLTGNRSTLGGILDAMSTGVWYTAIYCSFSLRLMREPVPFAGGAVWGGWIWLIALCCALLGQWPQHMLAEYYRNIHLYFLRGQTGEEWQRSRDIARQRARLPWKGARFQKLYLYFYAQYTYMQEVCTPSFQRLLSAMEERTNGENEAVRQAYLKKSRGSIRLTNVLAFNERAFVLFACVLLGVPYLYFPIELFGFGALMLVMRSRYERIAREVGKENALPGFDREAEKRKKAPVFFFLLGVVGIVVMLASTDLSQVDWGGIVLKRLPVWLPASLIVWATIYLMHTAAYHVILGEDGRKVSFGFLLKMTLSGFAMNAVTPVGFAGGEPYRIMELKPHVGMEKATSTTLTFTVMNTVSHVAFWFTGTLVYLLMGCRGGIWITLVVILVAAALGFALYMFVRGGQRGLVIPALTLLSRLPGLGNYFRGLIEKNRGTLEAIDRDMASFHTRTRDYWLTAGLEYAGRMVEVLEFYLILRILGTDVSYIACLVAMVTASLLGNLMFIIPMQVGSREGGLALALSWAGVASSLAVTAGLLSRIREIIYLAVGVAAMLIKNSPVAAARSEAAAGELNEEEAAREEEKD